MKKVMIATAALMSLAFGSMAFADAVSVALDDPGFALGASYDLQPAATVADVPTAVPDLAALSGEPMRDQTLEPLAHVKPEALPLPASLADVMPDNALSGGDGTLT